MALNQYSRTELVLGQNAMDILHNSRVAVFGVGGVGGNVIEALARLGVGTLDLIDDDRVCLTNLNRQLMATRSSVGKYKVDVAEERIHDIDPRIKVNKYQCFYLPAEKDKFDFSQWDYIVDAIDTVTAKIDIIEEAQRLNIPIISCMGCGNRVDPTKLEVTDIYQTKNDPLARVMRHELRKKGIKSLKVVYSTEMPIKPLNNEENSCLYHCICPPGTVRKCTDRRDVPGSTSLVPPAAGIFAASVIMQDLTKFDRNNRTAMRTWVENYRKDQQEENKA